MMALHQVHLTGRGQVIDASIYESVLNMMENVVTEYDAGGYIRERTGSYLPKIAPSTLRTPPRHRSPPLPISDPIRLVVSLAVSILST